MLPFIALINRITFYALPAIVCSLVFPGELFPQTASKELFGISDQQDNNERIIFELRTFNTAAEDPGQSRLIVQIGVANSQIQFIKHDKKTFRADLEVSVLISDTTGQEIINDQWTENFFVNDFDQTISPTAINTTQEFYNLVPGYYDLHISLTDIETKRQAKTKKRILQQDFVGGGIVFSDIIFLRSVAFLQQNSLPDFSRQSEDGLYAYYEIYNIPQGDTILLDYLLTDSEKEISGSKSVISKGTITGDYITIDRDSLMEQRLAVELRLHYGKQLIERKQRLNPASEKFSSLQTNVAEAIKVLIYIANKKELEHLTKLKGAEQIAAFQAFWLKHDPTPDTPENEYMIQYYRRIEIANKEFSDIEPGWKTPRGMVLVKLGPPQYVDYSYQPRRFDTFSSSRPLHYWHYPKYNRFVAFRSVGGQYRIANYNQVFDLIGGVGIRL